MTSKNFNLFDPATAEAAVNELRQQAAEIDRLRSIEQRAQQARRGNATLDNLEEAGWLNCADYVLGHVKLEA